MITLIHPNIDPVILSFGQISIRWYGLSYVLGFIIGFYLIKKINNYLKKPLNSKTIDDFLIWTALGVIFGGRIGYVLFYQTSSLINNPIEILYIWRGGMSFHGGLIGTFVSSLIFAYKKNLNFFILTDFITTVVPIGLFLGRIANFINVELYGRVTNFYIGMVYPTIDLERRHPSQIYEAIFEGLIIFIVLILIIRKNLSNSLYGVNTFLFLIMYGSFRFFIEFLREPDSHIGFIFKNYTMGQFLCIPMIIGGIIIYLFFIKKNESNKK